MIRTAPSWSWSDGTVIARRDEGLLAAVLDGELLGMSVEQGTCYGFNAPATEIWDILAVPTRLDVLCSRLVSEYEVDLPTCRADVTGMLDKLRTAGLIDVTN